MKTFDFVTPAFFFLIISGNAFAQASITNAPCTPRSELDKILAAAPAPDSKLVVEKAYFPSVIKEVPNYFRDIETRLAKKNTLVSSLKSAESRKRLQAKVEEEIRILRDKISTEFSYQFVAVNLLTVPIPSAHKPTIAFNLPVSIETLDIAVYKLKDKGDYQFSFERVEPTPLNQDINNRSVTIGTPENGWARGLYVVITRDKESRKEKPFEGRAYMTLFKSNGD